MRIPSKRPKLDKSMSKEFLERLTILSYETKGPQNMATKTAFVLGAFVAANFVSIGELNTSIGRYKEQLSTLEDQLTQEKA